MKARRTKVAIALLITMAALASIEFWSISSHSQNQRAAFERLRERMTIEEAERTLDRDLKRDIHIDEMIGVDIDEFIYQSEWWIFPRYEYHVSFVSGSFNQKNKRLVPFSETCDDFLFICKRKLGLNAGQPRTFVQAFGGY